MSLDFNQRECNLRAMASSHPGLKDLIEQFCTVTGASVDVAEQMLEACSSNLQMAIGMYMDSEEQAARPGSGSTSPAGTSNDSSRVAEVPQSALADNEDDVRAPIPQRNEILVQEPDLPIYPDYGGRRRRQTHAVLDAFRDFQAETRQHVAMLAGRPIDTKKRTLEDLFRPPIDLMFKGSFEHARNFGKKDNRWLLVNVQNVKEFACQVLNRDVWSNAQVRKLVKEKFVLWQVYSDSEEGRKYSQFYRTDQWPYVAVLDPRTGENLRTWHEVSPASFAEDLSTFLEEHCFNETDVRPPSTNSTAQRSIVDAAEEDQLQAAIRLSLEEAERQKTQTNSNQNSDLSSLSGEDETFTGSSDEDGSPPPIKKKKFISPKKSPKLMKDGAACATSNGVLDASSSSSCSSTVTRPAETLTSVDCQADPELAAIEWKDYLGNDEDPTYDLVLRFPDNQKFQLSLPCSSQLKALVLFVKSKGFSSADYELVTNFPRRHLSNMDLHCTLSQLELHPQETVFVQAK